MKSMKLQLKLQFKGVSSLRIEDTQELDPHLNRKKVHRYHCQEQVRRHLWSKVVPLPPSDQEKDPTSAKVSTLASSASESPPEATGSLGPQ